VGEAVADVTDSLSDVWEESGWEDCKGPAGGPGAEVQLEVTQCVLGVFGSPFFSLVYCGFIGIEY
jgi:hypothetical protein